MYDREKLPKNQWTDEQLLRAAHAGDTEAFEAFVVRSIPHLWRYIRYLLPQYGMGKDLARDFAQETALKALAKIRAHTDGRADLPRVTYDWLFAIARNLITDAFRKTKRGQAAFIMAAEVARSRLPSQEELDLREELREFFNWLNDRDREIIQLVFLESLSPEEAGRKMGLEKWAAYKAFERAIQRLRDLVEQHGKVLKKSQT